MAEYPKFCPQRPFVASEGFFYGKNAIIPSMSNERLRPTRFIWQRLDNIERLLADLRTGIEHMAQQTVVKHSEFEQIKYQVASFAEGMTELENRVKALEKRNSLEQWVFRQVGTVLLVALAAFLATRFF